MVAAIHRVPTAELDPPDPWYQEPVGADRWDPLVEELRQARALFAGRLADLRDELVALGSWIEPPTTLRTCHRDLWADNVLATPEGGVCVIDWENSGSADPSQELAFARFEFARTDWLHPNPRSPDRADSAAWIGEVLNEPHTRELLDSLLRSAS